jgi:ABC-2 type transport system ATP-binding protein
VENKPVSKVAIEISNLTTVRGKTEVIHNINLQIPRGQVTGLLGPSGSGKTTLMRAIVGVQKGVTGAITVLGQPAGSRALDTRVAYDTQSASVFDDLTVAQNLRYAARILGVSNTAIDDSIAAVGLGGFEKQMVVNLSGGQRNRVSLAVALLGKPELIVLDEPTVGLDPVLRRDLWNLFHKLAKGGATLLVSSHVMDEAERCDSLVLMRDGRVLAHDTLPNLLSKTKTDSAENAFLALIDAGEVAA